MQKLKQQLINLHDFQHQLFLGFISQQPLPKPQYQLSYIGGYPLWLYEPNPKLLLCQQCTQQPLTFLAQIFCPLDADHTYHRIIYLFYCEKCKRQFRCLKQQASKDWQPKQVEVKNYKVLTQESFEIESDPIERKELLKIINRAKIEVQEEIILEEEGQNDEQGQGQEIVTVEKFTGDQMISKLEELQKAKKNREYTEKEIEEINKKFESLKLDEKQQKQTQTKNNLNKQLPSAPKKDHMFQQYIRVIKAISNPMMLYSNITLPYNKLPLNPKHQCKHCGNKLQLQIQFTQKILLFHKNLAVLDWGSIFVYACVGSCQESEEECVVVQYELDAISEEEIAKLKKIKKNRKKNKNKSLSKEKKRLQAEGKGGDKMIEPQVVKSNLMGDDQEDQVDEENMKEKEQVQKDQKKQQEEGDWD